MNHFIALALPESLREALGAWPRPAIPAAWARPEGLHLTLAFLGGIDGTEAVDAVMDAVAPRHRAFALRTAGLGGFPSPERARVLWLGVEEEPRLRALAESLRAALSAAGLPFEARPFAPHITLARPKPAADLRGLLAPQPADFEVQALARFRSRGEGRYDVLREVPFI